jgi:hypothetical protein
MASSELFSERIATPAMVRRGSRWDVYQELLRTFLYNIHS